MPYRDPEAKKKWRKLNASSINAYNAAWKAANPEKVKSYKASEHQARAARRGLRKGGPVSPKMHRDYRRRLRADAIAAMGGACESCGFADHRALEFDHRTPLYRQTNGIADHRALEFDHRTPLYRQTNGIADHRALEFDHRTPLYRQTNGIADHRALEFDHRTPLYRQTNGIRRADGSVSAREILSLPDPREVYALLCANCHRIKTREGREWVAPAERVAREQGA